MTSTLAAAIGRALEQTRAANPAEATRIIQAALAGREVPRHPGRPRRPVPKDRGDLEDAEVLQDLPRHAAGPSDARPDRRRLGSVIDALRRGRRELRWADVQFRRPSAVPNVAEGARYERRSFSCAAGARDYRVYVPAALADTPKGLILMLHGCTQNADDFACGTRMNDLAEVHGLIVAYPEQGRGQNSHACWNWFRPADQRRIGGEPEILAGLARGLAEEFAVGPSRVFVAGLSAGGAMAATLGATHPETFGAVGVHSGLPHGAAHDVVSAFAAMRGDGPVRGRAVPAVPTIVFHGTADPTVHPSNAERIVAGAKGDRVHRTDLSSGGRRCSRVVTTDVDEGSLTELWLIDGAGHAWSGGAPEGSHTDPRGPDASAEMIRFFLSDAAGGRQPG
jgi:poly(hydroxyalkanoate) depolymerase family esterase